MNWSTEHARTIYWYLSEVDLTDVATRLETGLTERWTG